MVEEAIGEGSGFWELGVVKRVAGMEPLELRRLVLTLYQSLDQGNRGVAISNVRAALAGRRDVVFVGVKTKSALMGEKKMRDTVVKEAKKWSCE